MRRVLAIVAVAVLVVLALLVRSRSQSERQQAADDAARATLYCVKELDAVCRQIAQNDPLTMVVVEDAGATLAKVTASSFDPATVPLDGWLAPRTYIDQAEAIRARAGLPPLFDTPSRTLARSPVVAVMWNDRQQILARACGAAITWKCVGEHAGNPWSDVGGPTDWGDFQPALPSQTTATGLHDIAGATNSWFGGSSYATNDLADPAFREWIDGFASTSAGVTAGAPVPLDRMISARDKSIGAAGSLEALAAGPITQGRDKDNLSILYPAPVVTADLVLAPRRGDEPGGRLKGVLESDASARALADHGWRVDGQPLGAGLSSSLALAPTDGLPSEGVMEQLGPVWQAASR
jgi:hypothetical protein